MLSTCNLSVIASCISSMKMSCLFTFLTRHKYLVCCLALAITASSCADVSVLANNGHSNRDLKQVKVGFVSNLTDRWGVMAYHYVQMAISDFYDKHPNYITRLLLQARDSHNDVITSAANVIDLIDNEQVVAIIGPETSQEAQFDIRLGERSKVPIISYSASSPTLSSPYFIQATQDDSSQVQAISSIIQAFGWREVTPVYVDNEFGGGIIPSLVDALQQINTRIPYRCVISSSATDDEIEHELSNLRGKQTRVFVVHMNETLASRVFSLAKKSRMMSSEYVWIITSNIANALSTLDSVVIRSMDGVLGVKTYVPETKAVERFKARWSSQVGQMSLYGLWAYDATFLLAEAVEQVHHDSNFTFVEVNSTDALTFQVSNVGAQLIQKLANTSLEGVSGDFRLVNGKLQTTTFEIINVVGTGEKEIGFWTSEKGLARNLDGARNSTAEVNLGNIIWPGDSLKTPKGWASPTNENPLKIGVPAKVGFTEFVQASTNNSLGQPSGFCIDFFDAVRRNLEYDLPVRYIPCDSSYDDLISKVHSKEFDAVVGDVTIIANRSLFVDFALPYMESDVLMVVPVKDREANRTWAFLRPLSWKLWITTLCFFILIAVVVWVNEYQINDEFRAETWAGQIGLCLFYSFSTMVFSHKEVPKSNSARFVMVMWVFTLLLITQSYTASLASILTAEKLQPAYNDVDELLRTGKNVGYQNGTFVREYLHRMGFPYSKMLSYDTTQQLHDLFSEGSKGGGIDAAFDEAPYVKLFLARHCSHYTTVVPPMSRTDGFAFVFPIGSPLVSDISRAVLNITEGEIMAALSKQWLNSSDDCHIDPLASSSTLELDSFAALFVITGGACFAALVWKLSSFIYENRSVLLQRNGDMTFRKRLIELNRSFHAKKGTMSSVVSPELDSEWGSSRGSSPHRSWAPATEFDVVVDAGATRPVSPSPDPLPR